VETLPIKDWDNLTVFASALAADHLVCKRLRSQM
jgi:hypothetical protein